MRDENRVDQDLSEGEVEQDQQFIYILRNKRPILLDRLQSLGLLSSFQEEEIGTRPTF